MDQDLAALVVRLLFDDSDFQKGIKTTGQALQGVGGQMQRTADTINRQITTAFVAGTAAVVGFVGAATAIGSTFDREIRTVAAILGEGGAGLDAVTEKARELGRDTQFTATQAASALQNLARAGFSSAEAVAAAGPSIDLATASATSLDQATASLAATLAQFQLSAGQSSRVADVLANAAASTKFSLEGLTVALRQAGPAGQSVGLSLEETVAAVSQFRNIGLEASQSGTIFRNTIQRLVNPSQQAVGVIRSLGLELSDVDPTQVPFDVLLQRLVDAGAGTREFAAIFGRFGLQIQAVAENVSDVDQGFRALADTFESEVGRAAEIAAEQSQNVFTQLQILGSSVQEIFLQVFDALRGPLLTILRAVIEVVNEISGQFGIVEGEISNNLQSVADTIAEFLRVSRGDIASTFVEIARGVTSVVQALPSLIALLQRIGPPLLAIIRTLGRNLDLVALAGGVTLLQTAVASFAGSAISQLGSLLVVASQVATAFGTTIPAALSQLPGLLSRAAAAVRAFSVAVVTSTGGLAAIAVAIGVVIAGLIELTSRSREAARAQRLEAAEQEGFARELEAQIADRIRLQDVLSERQERAREEIRQAAEAGQRLSTARRQELSEILSLTAATLQQAIASGRVVETGGSILLVTEAVREFGEESVDVLGTIADEADQSVGNLRAVTDEISEIARGVSDVEGRLALTPKVQGVATVAGIPTGIEVDLVPVGEEQAARALVDQVNDALLGAQAGVEDLAIDFAAVQRRSADENLSLIKAAEAEIETVSKQAQARLVAREEEARNLRNQTAIEFEQAQERQTRAARRQADEQNETFLEQQRAAEDAARERERIVEESIRRLRQILEGEEQEQIGLLPEPDQLRVQAQRLLTEIEATRLEGVAAAQGNADQIAEINETAAQNEFLTRQRLDRQLAELAAEQAEQAAELAQQRSEIVEGEVTEAVQLRRRAAADIRRIEQLAADQRLATQAQLLAKLGGDPEEDARVQAENEVAARIASINEELAAQTLQIREKLQDDLGKLPAEAGEGFEDSLAQPLADGLAKIKSAAGAVLQVVGSVGDAMREIGDRVVRFADQISGGLLTGFDPFAIVGEIAGEVTRAADRLEDVEERFRAGDATREDVEEARERLAEAQRGLASGETARQFVDELVDGALLFVEAIATGLDDILIRFADALPDVLRAIADAIPVILRAIAEALPDIFSALAEAIPEILQAIAENLGPIVEALIRGASEAIQAIAAQLPEIVGALLEAIPGIITAIAEELPEVLAALVGSIGPVVEAIADALPDILVSLAEAIPQLLTVILDLIPTLLIESFRAFNTIKKAILDAVPDVILALIEELPELIAEFISLGPELMLGLALAFIEQIAGIVDSLINHLLPRLPEIALGMVKALLEAIFVSIREFVKLFAKILVQAVTSIGGLFGKKSDEDKAARRAERQARRDARRNAFDQPFADDEGRGFFEQIFGGRDEEGRGFLQRAFSGLAGNQGGIDFVGRTMASVLHPGEAVLTAPENFARLFGAGAVNATSPTSPFTSAPIAAASRGGGLSTLVVPVSIGGEDVQRVTVRLDQQGRSGAVNRMHRRKNGTHVGLERRR